MNIKELFLFLIFSFCIISTSLAQHKYQVEDDLYEWCEEYFENCYFGRVFISIAVDEIESIVSERAIEVYGRVLYLNLLEIKMTRYFHAKIRKRRKGFVIEFDKQDSFSSEEWEHCRYDFAEPYGFFSATLPYIR